MEYSVVVGDTVRGMLVYPCSVLEYPVRSNVARSI